ncbi:MAG TPA: 1,4-dihydroxy-2-naphthoate polyprenyltransferase [Virgibacillus sp.]|nr:1,4-dihydroxy-2-naphthoate polyprenyltransferase [Virgibacillus sp.]
MLMNDENQAIRVQEPSKGRILWQLTRPHTLTASFVPVIIGTVLAMFYVQVTLSIFIAMLSACLLIQIATNLFNEYYDFVRGLDTEDSVGIGGAIVRHGMKPKTVLQLALGSYGIALLIGIYICMNTSWWLAVIGVIGMAVGYLYTGGPYPIAYTPFGELFAGVFMGSLFILISFYIQTNMVNLESVLLSIPVAILVGAINLSNNIRDLDEDRRGGRKTLAILLGTQKAVYFLAGSFVIAYLWIIGLVVAGNLSPWILLVFLSVPVPVQAIKGFINRDDPTSMAEAMKATGKTNTIFGFLLAIGLFISYFV